MPSFLIEAVIRRYLTTPYFVRNKLFSSFCFLYTVLRIIINLFLYTFSFFIIKKIYNEAVLLLTYREDDVLIFN